MLPHQIERGWCYAGKGFESYEDLHRETLELLDKHPKLNAILAHFFFLSDDMAEAERIMEKYPNVYFDITPGTEMYENFAKYTDSWREFFIKYQERIIFGTDADDGSYLENADDLYRMIDGVPCFRRMLFLVQDPAPDDPYFALTHVEKDGTYIVLINTLTGVIEDAFYDTGAGGNG